MADIKHSIVIEAPPERVYPLVASGSGFTKWWAADVTENGGIADLGFFNRNTIYRLKPEAIDPPRKAHWLCQSGQEWEGTKLLFDLTPSGKNTLLRFMHANWRAETDYFVSCTTTWGELMFRIKAAAEGKTPGPLFSAGGMAY
jgi:uncharacterized protein YndB with AHSA1/START domain